MLMELLFAGRFDDWLREAAIGEEPCVFVHVPKTAGTSLRTELARRLQPDVNIAVDYADTSRSFQARMDEAVDAFLVRAKAAPPPRFASGHLLGRHVLRIAAALPGARFVTLLRDPVARVVSDYRHQRSPRHAVHRDFIRRVPSFDAYLELPSEHNKAAQHLVPPAVLQRGDAAECVAHVMRRYAFVGVQEMYPLCFRALTALLGSPAWPELRENVNRDDDGVQEVPPGLAARIRAANALDCAIHDAVLPRWQAQAAALAGRLA